jgi:hypothetical protein
VNTQRYVDKIADIIFLLILKPISMKLQQVQIQVIEDKRAIDIAIANLLSTFGETPYDTVLLIELRWYQLHNPEV